MSGASRQWQFKLVLLGESSVGKSSLVLRFCKDKFQEYQESTIGAAFITQSVFLEDQNAIVKFDIWDTAGQERYHSLAPMYYRGAQAAIVVYDITSADSFLKAQRWIRQLQCQCTPNCVIALAGNKLDRDDSRAVAREDGSKYAEENGLLFFETSARTGVNVRELFLAIARRLPDQVEGGPGGANSEGAHLGRDAASGGKSCC